MYKMLDECKPLEKSLDRTYKRFTEADTLEKKKLSLESVLITANGLLDLYKELQQTPEYLAEKKAKHDELVLLKKMAEELKQKRKQK